MANSYVRWRQNNLKKIWIWCIFLKLLITFPCIVSDCLGVNITLTLYPTGDIYVEYGSPLEIYCVVEDSSYTADDLIFSLGEDILESEVVNISTRRLYIEKPEKQQSTYYCKNKNNSKICPTRVLVETSPSDVKDFSCISHNLDVLNCSWSSPPDCYSKINYTLNFKANGQSVAPCQTEKIYDTWYCIWNATTQPRYRQQMEIFNFHLKTCNRFGCNDQRFRIDHFSIVKPDKPKILDVIPSPHNVTLRWNISFNMADLLACGVDHKVEYQIAKIDNITTFHPVDTSKLPPNKTTYKLDLKLPYAHRQYDVRIYTKSKRASDKYWSDYSFKVFSTTGERPRMPPGMIAGSFNQASYNNKRVIYVYWKQLEEYDEAGDNFTYRVLVTQNNRTRTLFPDKNEKSYLELDDASLDAINVAVWSSNADGLSENSSRLYIPPESDTHALQLKSFTQVANKNGTYELSWVGFDNLDNYSLFWCEHHSTKVCSDRMDYLVLDAHKNNHTIHLPTGLRYQFAISANNGTSTSGMVWATCDIAKEGIKLYNFPVHLDHDPPGKSFVNLKWSLVCTINEEIITGYNITYCPVIQTSTECDDTVGNKSVYISDPNKMYTNITNLLPFRTYQFTIALNTTSGLKSIENTTHSVTTLEDVPTEPRNVFIDVKNNSVVVSWDPPKYKNGNIREYVAYSINNDTQVHEEPYNMTDANHNRRTLTLTNLQGYTNYTFFVQVCNIALRQCSRSPSSGSSLRTTVGIPSKMDPPIVKSNPDFLEFTNPKYPSGSIDLYQIKRVNDEEDIELYNTTNLWYEIKHCVGDVKEVTYQVRAFNFDEDLYHGALAYDVNITIPKRHDNQRLEYPSEWSDIGKVNCQYRDGLTMVFIIMALFMLGGTGYGTFKLYKKYRKIQDIKPVLPVGLGIPEKDISKYAFISSKDKDEKPSSDEALLLPNTKSTVSPPVTKQTDNCGASDQTDTTALSDTSQGHIERQVSTSDDGSSSSLELDVDTVKITDSNLNEEDDNTSRSETESSRENSPCFSDKVFKKNPTSGYVQPVVNSSQLKGSPLKPAILPASSSYVMASLAPSVIPTNVPPLATTNHISRPSGYVLPDDVQSRSNANFPKFGHSPIKPFIQESLLTIPTLPPSKREADSSYIPLQSLDAMPSLKPNLNNTVPLKQRASNGYVSPGEAVISKHLSNMLNAGQLSEEPAILDPEMSPDAYCRFSWSTDPANDNLHTLLGDSPSIDTSRN